MGFAVCGLHSWHQIQFPGTTASLRPEDQDLSCTCGGAEAALRATKVIVFARVDIDGSSAPQGWIQTCGSAAFFDATIILLHLRHKIPHDLHEASAKHR